MHDAIGHLWSNKIAEEITFLVEDTPLRLKYNIKMK
jgi:hypothetical protein